jgi:phosphatidylglycerol:prolipoprotein diacylglycerol transferase
MRPVLVEIPSKVLFFVAVVWAIAAFVLDLRRRKADPSQPRSSTPLTLLVGAFALLRWRGGTFIPTPGAFSHPWDGVPIHSYGVMLGSSMIIGWFLTLRLAKEDGIPSEPAGQIFMWSAVYSIVGARLLYCIVQWRTLNGPLDVFMIWQGGLVAYGGMIGGFLASWYNCWRKGIPLLRWADVAAPCVVLGTAITRVGCLLFGCDYGQLTQLPWGITFPKGSPAWNDHFANLHLPAEAARSFAVHPTQVYEMLAGLFLFGLLMFLRKVRKFSGMVFLGWVIGYGILRPIIETFRDDDERGTVGALSTSQFIGITSVVLGVVLLAALLRKYRRDPEAARLWEQPLALAVAGAGAPDGPPGGKSPAKRRRAK